MSEEITVKIKQTTANKTDEIKIYKDAGVLDLKKKVEEATGMKPESQNLVYRGKILDNAKTVADYGLQNDHVIILVKKYVEEKKETQNTTTTTTTNNSNNTTNPLTGNSTGNTGNTVPNNQDPFSMFGGQNNMGMGLGGGLGGLGGMGGGGLGGNMDMNQLNGIMSNPMYQQAMDQMLSNPQMMQQMLDNPRIKPLLDSNPQLRQMMSNPDFMRMMLNPQTMNMMMNMQQGGGMGGLGGMGGFPNTGNNTGTDNTQNNQGQQQQQNPFQGVDLNSLCMFFHYYY